MIARKSTIINNSVILLINNDRFLLKNDGKSYNFLMSCDVDMKKDFVRNIHYIGIFENKKVFCTLLSNEYEIKDGFAFFSLREMLSIIHFDLWKIAGMARQIVDWDMNFKYCGRCGKQTIYLQGERAKKCPSCQLINYPRLSPAMIVAVIRGKQLLLAKLKGSKLFLIK